MEGGFLLARNCSLDLSSLVSALFSRTPFNFCLLPSPPHPPLPICCRTNHRNRIQGDISAQGAQERASGLEMARVRGLGVEKTLRMSISLTYSGCVR